MHISHPAVGQGRASHESSAASELARRYPRHSETLIFMRGSPISCAEGIKLRSAVAQVRALPNRAVYLFIDCLASLTGFEPVTRRL